jgi:YHS domain-containing protein
VAVAVLAELVALKAAGKLRPRVAARPLALAVDPVCGMEVDLGTARHRGEHDGRAYAFCAAGCQRAFEADPTKYLARAEGSGHE